MYSFKSIDGFNVPKPIETLITPNGGINLVDVAGNHWMRAAQDFLVSRVVRKQCTLIYGISHK